MESKMGYAGKEQGDMSPHVMDYQKPESTFAERGFSKTTSYIERKDSFEKREASSLDRQAYKGRYS